MKRKLIAVCLNLLLIFSMLPSAANAVNTDTGMGLSEIKSYLEGYQKGTGQLHAEVDESTRTIKVTGSMTNMDDGGIFFNIKGGITIDWQADLSGSSYLLSVYEADRTNLSAALKISNCTIEQTDKVSAISTNCRDLIIEKGALIKRDNTQTAYILIFLGGTKSIVMNGGEIRANSGTVIASKGTAEHSFVMNGGIIHSFEGRIPSETDPSKGSITGAGISANPITINDGSLYIKCARPFNLWGEVKLNGGALLWCDENFMDSRYGEEMRSYIEDSMKNFTVSPDFTAIAWDISFGNAFQADTSTGLMIAPQAATAVWQTSGGRPGVSYKNGAHSGFIPAMDATVTGGAPAPTPYPGTPFLDINDHWGREAAKWSYEKGLFSGVSDSEFAPDGEMNRAMLATVLYRLAGEPAVSGSVPYNDVAIGAYYTNAVIWASEVGVVTGTGQGRFSPNQNISREQLATMLYRYACLSAEVEGKGDLNIFTDQSDISSWARAAMIWAVGEGILTGKGNGILDSQGPATRAEVSTILQRYCA